MKKRILAWLLACCFVLSAVPVSAGAATGQQVTAGDVTVTAGNTAAVTLKAENFENIAALDVYIYYDATVLTVSSTSTGTILSGAQASVNTAEPGVINISTMALGGMNGSGNFLTVRFSTKSDAAPGTYPVTVAIGRAFDGNFAPAAITGVSGSVTVTKPTQTVTFSLSNTVSTSYLEKGDEVTWTVRNSSSSRTFVSAEFTVEYDHELFSFVSVELASGLTQEGAIYSVNSATLGRVRIAYASENEVRTTNLFTVKLQVVADVTETATLKAEATNVCHPDLSLYLPGSTSRSLYLTKLPEVVDYPNAYLQTEKLILGQESRSLFTLEAGTGVSAADFRISYDPTVLRCLGVSRTDTAGNAMVIINDSFREGQIRFSYINMDDTMAQITPVEILWEPVQAAGHYEATISGVGVVNGSQQAVTLEYVTDTGCIYTPTVTKEPTRTEEGRIDYACGCGASFSEVLPAIPNPAAQAGSTLYVTLEEALKKAPAGGVLQLLQTDAGDYTLERSLALDLNGFALTGALTVSDGCTLTLLDTQTDDFTVEDGAGYGIVATLNGNVTAAEGYLLIREENGTSAHRVSLEITDMVLRPSATGVYYKSAFAMDQVVARNVDVVGVALSIQGQPTQDDPRSWYKDISAGNANGTLLKGILKTTYDPETNAANGQLEIYGSAYLRTNDGQYLFGSCVSRSLRQQLELIDAGWDTLDETQKSALVAMYQTYAAVMGSWNIPNLQGASK